MFKICLGLQSVIKKFKASLSSKGLDMYFNGTVSIVQDYKLKHQYEENGEKIQVVISNTLDPD